MSSESHTDRGDRNQHDRPQPNDGGLRQLIESGRSHQQQPSRPPSPTSSNTGQTWRGSAWLHPNDPAPHAEDSPPRTDESASRANDSAHYGPGANPVPDSGPRPVTPSEPRDYSRDQSTGSTAPQTSGPRSDSGRPEHSAAQPSVSQPAQQSGWFGPPPISQAPVSPPGRGAQPPFSAMDPLPRRPDQDPGLDTTGIIGADPAGPDYSTRQIPMPDTHQMPPASGAGSAFSHGAAQGASESYAQSPSDGYAQGTSDGYAQGTSGFGQSSSDVYDQGAAGSGQDADPRTEVFDTGALERSLAGGPVGAGAQAQPTAWSESPDRGWSDSAEATTVIGDRGFADDPSAPQWPRTGGQPPVPPRGPRPQRPAAGGGQGPLAALRTPRARRILLVAAVVFGVAFVGYLADLFMSSGKVPRGVEVAGVQIGGMDKAQARGELQTVLDAKAASKVPVRISDVQTEVVPRDAGLSVDWDATWERIGGQPLNPAIRLFSLFDSREVAPVSAVEETAFAATMDRLKFHDQPPVEGGIQFEGTTPVAVDPVPGRVLDQAAARTVLTEQWATASVLELPEAPDPPDVRKEAIQQALTQIAQPAVSAPVVYQGLGNAQATLSPEQIASVVRFVGDGNGGLRVDIDQPAAIGMLAPQLAGTEVEPKDASFEFGGSAPRVVPAVIGDKVNWAKSLEQLPNMLTATGPQRTVAATYEKVEPKLTTAALEGLGVTEVTGEFTTGGFSGPSGVNIRLAAQELNGAVVKPGETFSLNGHTGPRGAAEGYVESGIVDHGRPSKAVGGGISQLATTLYNASYFAGMEDAGHTEHSYYISRYPEAREATVFDGAIDLQFTNKTPFGVYIQAFADSSQVTVRFWSTKTVQVQSITGERTKPTEPQTITLPKGDDCIASQGAPGFTSSDTRVITDIKTGQVVSRTTRTVKYDPVPEVKCVSPEDEKQDKASEDGSGQSGSNQGGSNQNGSGQSSSKPTTTRRNSR